LLYLRKWNNRLKGYVINDRAILLFWEADLFFRGVILKKMGFCKRIFFNYTKYCLHNLANRHNLHHMF